MSELLIRRAAAIDPVGAQDRDDAIWVRRQDHAFQVTVAITNVAAVVAPGTPADATACAQGSTLYRAASAVKPMLPHLLEQRLSLAPRQAKSVLAVEATILPDLSVQCQLHEAVLEQTTALDYAQVQPIIDGATAQAQTDGALQAMLIAAAQLATLLLTRRRARGALALYDLSSGTISTEEGTPIRLAAGQQHIGYLIVQELMILANEQIALWAAQQSLPLIYRNHQARTIAPPREHLLADLDAAAAHPQQFDLATLQRRMQLVLEPASYGVHIAGHYALNLPCYTHSTSPLRRYADLRTQQIVLAQLRGAPLPAAEETALICEHLNRLALERSKEQQEWFKSRARQQSFVRGQAEQLADLNADEFHEALKVRLRTQQVTAAIIAETERRLSSDLAQPRDAFIILFSTGTPPQLCAAAGNWLGRYPEQALSLLAMHVQLEQLPALEFEEFATGAGHVRRFSARAKLLLANGVRYGETRYADTKKKARAQAALSLVCGLTGLAERSKDMLIAPSAPTSEAAPGLPVATGHPVSALNEWLQRRELPPVEYRFSYSGIAHHPEIACRCVLQLEEGVWIGEGSGCSKAEAKASAAAALITALRSV